MILTDLRFLALFAACWLSFFALPRRWRSGVLAFWGMAFYFAYAPAFLPVVLALTAATWLATRGGSTGAGAPEHESAAPGVGRGAFWIAAAAILALLFWFKLGRSAAPLPRAAGTTAGVLVPLGFSYLSFELLHVLIERRRGRLRALDPLALLAFVFFTPARVAGPIKRFPEFTAAVAGAERSAENVYRGLLRVLVGLAKKLLLADVLALTVAESRYVASPRHAWMVVLAFALQIYFDFSAYSDMAIGLARMLGIVLPENFRRPYLAPNLREFWDRWHITLSHWVRDYVFLPVGQALFRTRLRRRPVAIAALSYLAAFLVVGAWHGLAAGYLVWGAYHGVLLTGLHVVRLRTPARISGHPWYRSSWARALSVATTFFCVTVGWVPFMLPWPEARKLLAWMFGAAL